MKLATYGSLRLGMYNLERIKSIHGKYSMLYIKTSVIKGYKLYSLGVYPGILPGEPTDEVVVDIFEVSPEAFRSIYNMELGAGYSLKDYQDEGEKVMYYEYDYPISSKNAVKSGDWSLYLKNNQLNKLYTND
jgi:gamma-glutamylcyclotransferase (GGCT)/AIG2-like uncharacterized protein YtfP